MPIVPRHSPLLVLPVAAALVLGLAGCGSSGSSSPSSSTSTSTAAAEPSPVSSAVPCSSRGSASDAVRVSGAAGAEPKVKFPTPTTVSMTERTVVKEGTGAAAKLKETVRVAFALYDGKSGKRIQATGYGSSPAASITLDTAKIRPGFVEAIACNRPGSRFAAVMPASRAFGSAGATQLGVAPGDSLVLVGDLLARTPTRADGVAKRLPAGFPTVTLAADGRPTVAIPKSSPPTTLRIAETKSGSGTTVKDGDSVTVQYQGSIWRTRKMFQETWGDAPTTFPTGGVVKGFKEALVGHRVGSQVVAIIPPGDGYGAAGSPDVGIKGTDTLVFVVDILETGKA